MGGISKMPMYTYHCKLCYSEIDIHRPISARDDEVSKEELHTLSLKDNACKHTWERKIHAGSFHLLGSGWFKDGY